MNTNNFNIKSRIFKRERVRENKNNLIIVSKARADVEKNQLELSWKNNALERAHLAIVGRVTINEWERQLSEYPITRSFMQFREDQDIRLYISFQVTGDLSSKEIRSIVDTVTRILVECLEKVMQKVDIPLPIPSESHEEEKAETVELINENNELIENLHKEIEEQDNLLKNLTLKQNELQQETLEEQYQKRIKDLELFNQKMETEISELNAKVTVKEQEILKLNKSVSENEKINLELDKANIKLNEIVQKNKIDKSRLEKLDLLENTLKQIKAENSDYRIQLNESQHMVEQYKNTTSHLSQSVSTLEKTHKEFIDQAQKDISKIEIELKESETKILIETNERQKSEIQLDETQKKLVKEIRSSEKKDTEIRRLNLELDKQLKQREQVKEEFEGLQQDFERLQNDFKMSQVTNEILKEELSEFEEQAEKLKQIDEWQMKYEGLESKYDELLIESASYRQEISLLKSQWQELENRLVESEEKQLSYNINETVKAENKSNLFTNLLDEEEYEDDYFSYESDPYVEEVITEELMNIRKKDQMEDERDIKEHLEYYYEDGFKDMKVGREEYRKHILNFKFLSFRWSQVFIINDLDKNTAFLEWCEPFIEEIESFEEELTFDVRKSFFAKNYVTMDESTYEILQGYSKLSTYLDTYYLQVSYYIDKYFLNEGNRVNNAK